MPDATDILIDVATECLRADEKHGEQFDTPSLVDGGASHYGLLPSESQKELTDSLFRTGVGTWGDILIEEVAEAFDEVNDPVALRAELVQVAAVALRWIRKLDTDAEAVAA